MLRARPSTRPALLSCYARDDKGATLTFHSPSTHHRHPSPLPRTRPLPTRQALHHAARSRSARIVHSRHPRTALGEERQSIRYVTSPTTSLIYVQSARIRLTGEQAANPRASLSPVVDGTGRERETGIARQIRVYSPAARDGNKPHSSLRAVARSCTSTLPLLVIAVPPPTGTVHARRLAHESNESRRHRRHPLPRSRCDYSDSEQRRRFTSISIHTTDAASLHVESAASHRLMRLEGHLRPAGGHLASRAEQLLTRMGHSDV